VPVTGFSVITCVGLATTPQTYVCLAQNNQINHRVNVLQMGYIFSKLPVMF